MASMDVSNSYEANQSVLVTSYGAVPYPVAYMYHMAYGGCHTLLPETGLGTGPSAILGLAEQAQVPQGWRLFHDNLFTSLAFLHEMTKRGYGSSLNVLVKLPV